MNTNKALLGILTAAAVGAVIGLLFAPEEGNQTRKKIKKKTNSLATDLIEALERSKEKASNVVGQVKEEGEEYKDAALNKAEEYTDAAKEEVNKYR
jgi:gas vesicle protein